MSLRGISTRYSCFILLGSFWFTPVPAKAQKPAQNPPGDGNAVALVNGHPIARDELMKILLEAHGVDVLQQMILLRVAKQELQQRGLKVTEAEVTREFQSSLDSIAENAGMDLEFATEENKHKALRQVLDERGISLEEFMIGMERNAYLRKLAELDMRVTEETLREEFARKYGARVQISHIQIPQRDSRALNQAIELLGRGSEFADVARRMSKNPETAARGGLMEPFAFDDPDIPAALKETAFRSRRGGSQTRCWPGNSSTSSNSNAAFRRKTFVSRMYVKKSN